MNVEVLEQIASDNSRLVKEALLPKLDKDLIHFVKLALDPDTTFGITIDEDEAEAHPSEPAWGEGTFVSALKDLLRDCAARKISGGAAQDAMWRAIHMAPTQLHRKWAARIINRNLRAGFDIRTFNSVFEEDQVKAFAVQLAEAYESQELKGLWFFQPKLDGNRVVFIDGKAMSRSGKEYPNCGHVVEEILSKDPEFFEKWVLDGEMMGDLGFDESSGALRRHSQKNRKQATFTYWAFDLIDREEWEHRSTRNLFYRDAELRNVVSKLGLQTVKLVPNSTIYNPTHQQVMEICAEHVKAGFEGAMAKQAESPYSFKRRDNILKVKLFSEDEFNVVGFYGGRGRNKDTLGGFWIEGEIDWSPPCSGLPKKHYSIKSKCGGGFSDPMRKIVWEDQAGWLGAVVQVQFFEATKDGSLRFPVFITRRKDKEGGVHVGCEASPGQAVPRKPELDVEALLDELEKE